jgi:hypothetical protein
MAHARVLGESFLDHHPQGRFSVLAVGFPEGMAPGEEPFEVLTLSDLGIEREELHRRATIYAAQGCAGSFKPNLLAFLLARERSPIAFFDADTCVYAPLEPLAELVEQRPLVLSPHRLDPYPLHGVDPSDPVWLQDSPEQIVSRAGVMNAGLVGVGPGAEGFLEWWGKRTSRRCVLDEAHGLMLCQTWLTLAVAFFEHAVLRDRGCNVAGWNLHGREIEWDGATPTVDGSPLRHFHFAGSFDPESPERLTPIDTLASWWAPLQEHPGVARLAGEYAQALLDRGYREARTPPWAFDLTPEGAQIEPWMRAVFRAALMEAERIGAAEPPNPFDAGSDHFFEWLERHTAEEMERLDRPSSSRDTLSAREMSAALLESSKRLERVRELETIRDEAVSWAERVSSELRDAESALLAADADRRELKRLRATMESVWRSPSWRITRPLRTVKALLARTTK